MATDPEIEILTPEQRQEVIGLIWAQNLTDLGVRTVKPSEKATAHYFYLQGRPWSVISQWFTKALADNNLHLWRTSLANHNDLYAQRDLTTNIVNPLVSGFDGWNLDGTAWYLRPLPMNDARWNNANHPSMFLWAAQKLLEKSK